MARTGSGRHEAPARWIAAGGVAAYGLFMLSRGKLGWQHLGLLPLVWACTGPGEGGRRFLRDWWPLVLFWLAYDSLRTISPHLYGRVSVEPPFRWEAKWFLSPSGVIWPFHFARLTETYLDSGWFRLMSLYCNIVYLTQLFGVPVILMIQWLRGETVLFRRMVWSLSALHAMSLFIYLSYPAAPPWWVYENGFTQPGEMNSMPREFARGSALAGLFHLSPNRFAAIPSLHGAYPLLLTLVLGIHGCSARWVALAGLYAISMWFACVFLNQHYIVDLLIGAVLAVAALPVAALVRVEDRTVRKNEGPAG